MNILDFNKHRNKNFFYDFSIKRLYLDILTGKLENKFITLLFGLRRVGKTTLMFQMINYLIERGTTRDSILYYTFDDGQEPEYVINDYLKVSNKDINKDKIYVFFDEIQKVSKWQNKIKIYYDLYPNIKFILSGSSSIFLKATESLAGRIESLTIKPLFFSEYLSFVDKKYYLEKPDLYKKNLILEFEKYLYRQFFDTINLNLIETKKYMKDLKNKIIREDANLYFDIKHPDILVTLFDIIANKPGLILDYKNLSNDLGIDWRTLQSYVFYLEESFLIKRLYNFSNNLLSSEKKQKKIYLNACSFFDGHGEVTGELFENYIQNYTDYKYFWRNGNDEVDFLDVDLENNVSAIEVKYKDKLKTTDFRGLKNIKKKFAIKYSILVSKGVSNKIDDIQVVSFLQKYI